MSYNHSGKWASLTMTCIGTTGAHANGSNNLWAADALQILYSASDGSSAVIGRSSLNSSGTALFSEGAQFDLDVDEVPGTASTGPLVVQIFVVGN